MNFNKATKAVVTVGDGRGFIVEGPRGRLIITAAHCLPRFPPAAANTTADERTYGALVSRLHEKPAITVECLFADPFGDLAILGEPDGQELELREEAVAYDALVDKASPLRVGKHVAPGPESARMLSLNGQWFRCQVTSNGGRLWIVDAEDDIIGGMSGSPILSNDGVAIGVVCAGVSRKGGPNPRLTFGLPGWMLREPN
jgi:hypothetical protein